MTKKILRVSAHILKFFALLLNLGRRIHAFPLFIKFLTICNVNFLFYLAIYNILSTYQLQNITKGYFCIIYAPNLCTNAFLNKVNSINCEFMETSFRILQKVHQDGMYNCFWYFKYYFKQVFVKILLTVLGIATKMNYKST